MSPLETFPLMSLPDELILYIVLNFCFGKWTLRVSHDEFTGFFKHGGAPPSQILQTCKKIYDIGKDCRRKSFSGTIVLDGVSGVAAPAYSALWRVPSVSHDWIFNDTKTLIVNSEPWNVCFRFPNLQRIELVPRQTFSLRVASHLPDLLGMRHLVFNDILSESKRRKTRAEWDLDKENKCKIFNMIYIKSNSTDNWWGKVKIKYCMDNETTSVLEVTHEDKVASYLETFASY